MNSTEQIQNDSEENVIQELKEDQESSEAVKEITYIDIIKSIVSAYNGNGTDEIKKECNNLICKFIEQIYQLHAPCASQYNIIILYDQSSLIKGDSDNIYKAITRFKSDKPILLILYSRGGSAASAYLIGKLCREYSFEGNLNIAVPRIAKSAATLICCAANKIHMGSLSELGPIDPQIEGLPALGLKNAVEHIADLVNQKPEAAGMFAKYLNSSLPLINLGYYERVAESAMQYAERLLSTHKELLPNGVYPKDIADSLVYKYKDHGFVIDKTEATEIFGGSIIQMNTCEYELSNDIYLLMDIITSVCNNLGYSFYFIGSAETGPSFIKRKS